VSERLDSGAYRAWMLTLLLLAYASSFVDRIIVNVVGQAIIADLGLSDLQFGLRSGWGRCRDRFAPQQR
jgi:hypothetical protein